MRKRNVEVNGPANIMILVDMIFENDLKGLDAQTLLDLKRIRTEAARTVNYINTLSNPDNVDWHNVKAD